MKNLTTRLLILLCLATTPVLASADDRFDERRSTVSASGEWRLGEFRGERLGYEILYRAPGRSRWQVAPGSAMAIGDGWVLGTDRHTGGYGIYRWNGRNWSRMPGTAVRIGGSYRQPWVVNDSGTRYVWNGYEWRRDNRGGDDRRYRRDERDGRGWRDRDNDRDRGGNRRWDRD